MKYLLLATCLMVLNFCNGQETDFEKSFRNMPYYYKEKKSLPERDTIPVIFLACDTASITGSEISFVGALRGYSVRVRANVNDDRRDGGWCMNCEDYMKAIEYLNYKKEPLSKNILVWDVKNVQQ